MLWSVVAVVVQLPLLLRNIHCTLHMYERMREIHRKNVCKFQPHSFELSSLRYNICTVIFFSTMFRFSKLNTHFTLRYAVCSAVFNVCLILRTVYVGHTVMEYNQRECETSALRYCYLLSLVISFVVLFDR